MNWKHSSPEASNENIKSAMHEKKRREKNTEKWKPSIIFILGACRKAVVWTVLYLKMNISIHPFFWSRPKTFSVKLLSSFGWFAFRLDWISSREKKLKQKRIQRIVDKFLWICELLWILQYLLFNPDVHFWRVHAFINQYSTNIRKYFAQFFWNEFHLVGGHI